MCLQDHERLRKTDGLDNVNAKNAPVSHEQQNDRHAYFSPDIEVLSSSSGEAAALSTEDINSEIEKSSQEQSFAIKDVATESNLEPGKKIEVQMEDIGNLEKQPKTMSLTDSTQTGRFGIEFCCPCYMKIYNILLINNYFVALVALAQRH